MATFKGAPGGQALAALRTQITIIGANDNVTPNNYIELGDFYDSLSGVATVSTIAEFNAAIASSAPTIKVTASIIFDQDITILINTRIITALYVQVSQAAFQIDKNSYDLTIESDAASRGAWTYLPTVEGNRCVKDGSVTAENNYLKLINMQWTNHGSVANTSLCEDSPIIDENCLIASGSADNAGINYNQKNSKSTNLFIMPEVEASTNSLVVADSVLQSTGLTIYNLNGVVGVLATIGQNNIISDVIVYGDSPVDIESKGVIVGLRSIGTTNTNVTLSGFNPCLTNANLLGGTLTLGTAASPNQTVNPTVTGCASTGAFSIGTATGYVGAGNSGTIPNSGSGSTNFVSAASESMINSVETYVTENAALTTLTLPVNFSKGQVFSIIGNNAGGWEIAQNAGQTILINSAPFSTTAGVMGYISSANQGDTVQLIAVIDNTTFRVVNSMGNITIN